MTDDDTYPRPLDELDNDELDAAYDRACDARSEAESALQEAREMYVSLDGIADTADLNPEVKSLARDAQGRVRDLIDRLEVEEEKWSHRREKIQTRLDDDT